MSAEYVVEWHELLPFDGFDWQSSLQFAVSVLRNGSPVRFRAQHDESSDLLLVAYMAGDHERIVQGQTLAAFLGGRADLGATTVVLVACANRKPALPISEVRELLIEQGAGLKGPKHLRSKIPATLTEDCRSLLLRCLEERQLMELPPAQFEESETVISPRLNPQKRRFENI